MKSYKYTIHAIKSLQLLCHWIVTTIQLHRQQYVDVAMMC